MIRFCDNVMPQQRQRRILVFHLALVCIAGDVLASGSGSSIPSTWRRSKISIPLLNFPTFSKVPVAFKRGRKSPFQRAVSTLQLPSTALAQMILAAESTIHASKTLKVDPIAVVLVTNCLVHGLWLIATKEHVVELYEFLNRHFVLRPDDFGTTKRIHTLLLSAFSHESPLHLTSNMSALLLIGPTVSKGLGRRLFSYFYIASIYASDLFDQIIYSRQFHHKYMRILWWKIPIGSLGASGAISALLTLSCLRHPAQRHDIGPLLKVDEPVHVPAWLMYLFVLVGDLFPVQKNSNIGHGAHLGGHIFGAVVYLSRLVWKQWIKRRRRRRQRQCKRQGFTQWTRRKLQQNCSSQRLGWIHFWQKLVTWKNEVGWAWDKWIDQMEQGILQAQSTALEELRYQLQKAEERHRKIDLDEKIREPPKDVGENEADSEVNESPCNDLANPSG